MSDSRFRRSNRHRMPRIQSGGRRRAYSLLKIMTKIIYIDGLEVELTRKRIKRMNMRIKAPDGRIVISAPYLVPDSDVIAFVRSRRDWIDRTAARVRAKAAAHPDPASKTEKEARRRALKRRIEARLPIIEEATGLYCSGWTVRSAGIRVLRSYIRSGLSGPPADACRRPGYYLHLSRLSAASSRLFRRL